MINFLGEEPYPISKQMRALDSFRSLASDSRASRKKNVSSVNKDQRGLTGKYVFFFFFFQEVPDTYLLARIPHRNLHSSSARDQG